MVILAHFVAPKTPDFTYFCIKLSFQLNASLTKFAVKPLYFLFNSARIRDLIQIRSTGTKVKHTSPTKMEEIEVFLPPIELQKEFSKYCRLENNNSDYDIVRVEELVNSITQEMFA